jgi:hypothetical protein
MATSGEYIRCGSLREPNVATLVTRMLQRERRGAELMDETVI